MLEEHLNLKPTCVHLRHKLMYVDERQAVPGYVDDQSDTRVFWCEQTMDPLGPDRRNVKPGDCQASRDCYCAPTSRRPEYIQPRLA